MSRHRRLLVGTSLLSALGILNLSPASRSSLDLPSAHAAPLPAHSSSPPVLQNYARLPLSFELNQGQTDRRVQFMARSSESTLFLTPTEAVFTMTHKKPAVPSNASLKDRRQPTPTSLTALRMQMLGADPHATALTRQPLAGRVNYFIGKDPKKWHAGVPTFGRVGFHGVYPGVDLVYYGNPQHLEYDFVVAPHADPAQIQLRFAGTDNVRVDRQGDLIVGTQGRTLTWRKPSVYQESKGGKQPVAGRFRLKALADGQSQVSFALGNYDARRSLVIDPILTYSTLIGGTSTGQDSPSGIAVDSAGNAYVAGVTGAADFPTMAGAYQPTNTKPPTSGSTSFITKFNATGTALIYSTYLSGSASDVVNGIALDATGAAYVAGTTTSSDFPTTPGAFQKTNKGGSNTGFVTKLNPTGSALAYSTYLGGSNGGEFSYAIAVDGGGNAYVTGLTASTDFPVTPGAFQTTKKAAQSFYNAFVTRLNSTGTALVYSTYLGGTGNDYGYAIAVDGSGAAYVGGQTQSADFPVTEGAFQTTKGAGQFTLNSFVTKVDPTGASLDYSTYLRETNTGSAHGIAVDSTGNAYVTGFSTSTDFPTTPGAFQTTNRAPSGNQCAYVIKLNPTGSAPVYSTYLGGTNYSTAVGIAVDRSGNASVVGYTGAADFPTTVAAFERIMGGGAGTGNVFVTKVDATGAALIYSTLIAANSTSISNGIALDSHGNAYVTGRTFATNFPVTQGAFQTTNRSSNGTNVFVTKLSTNPIFPDFNNNGYTDLLIQNSSSGAIASWFMQGSTWTGGAYFSLTPPIDYALVGVGDFGGAGLGITTLVFQSSITNKIIFWYTGGVNNATVTGGDVVNVTPPAGWKVVGVGDFNGDGKSDLVLQNQITNQVAVWFMSGHFYQGGVQLANVPNAGWAVVGVGDFNADGMSDLVLQNQSTGQIAVWYMNGTTYAGGSIVATVPAAGWKVVGVGDYNGDGYADLLFQSQATNQAAVWYLKGGTFQGGNTLTLTPPAGWHIVAPR